MRLRSSKSYHRKSSTPNLNEHTLTLSKFRKIPTALFLSSEGKPEPLFASVQASPSSNEVVPHSSHEQAITCTPTELGQPAPDVLQPAAIINDPPTSAVHTVPNSIEHTTEGTTTETLPFDHVQDLLHVEQQDLNDHDADVPVQAEDPPANVTEDTELLYALPSQTFFKQTQLTT